jgi:alpha-D-ribose 1-methylphosphonate 5-triphosphate synthase subunit PhnH
MRISDTDMMAQRAFRTLLQAMSRPGRVFELPPVPAVGSGPWSAMLVLMQSLLDQEVGLAVIGGRGSGFEELQSLIAKRTRCRKAGVEQADFFIIADGDSRGEILRAKRGTLQYPDTSATVVFSVRSLLFTEEEKPAIALRGPGIRQELLLGPIQGLGPRELEHLKALNSDFPLGVDAVFIDAVGRILCIPRSTTIRIMEH